MAQLPSELLIDVFRLACADGLHGVEQRLHLAQVCAYWRAVALDYPTFWAHIGVRTSRDAALLPIALERSSGGVLDVELCWQRGSDERILSAAEQRAAVEVLLAPVHRLRLRRLSVRYMNMRPASLLPLLCAGDVFPALHDLVMQGTYGPLPYLAPRLEAPSLRTLVLSGLELNSWHAFKFIAPSLEHLFLHVVQYDNSDRLLNNILVHCTKLRRLEWNIKPSAAVPMLSDGIQSPLAPGLDTLRLGEQVCAFDVLRLINQRRLGLKPINDITVTVHIRHYIDSGILELLPEGFFRTSALVHLRIEETDREVVIRDDVGRIRRLIVGVEESHWNMSGEWNAFAAAFSYCGGLYSGFSKQPPVALTEVYILLHGGIEYKMLDYETWILDRDQDEVPPPRILSLPNMRRLVIRNDNCESLDCSSPLVSRVREILQHIECGGDASNQVEVCLAGVELPHGEQVTQATQTTLLDGLSDKWVLCSYCTGVK